MLNSILKTILEMYNGIPRKMRIVVIVLIAGLVAYGMYLGYWSEETTKEDATHETITTDHVVIGEPDTGSGVFDGESAVQPER